MRRGNLFIFTQTHYSKICTKHILCTLFLEKKKKKNKKKWITQEYSIQNSGCWVFFFNAKRPYISSVHLNSFNKKKIFFLISSLSVSLSLSLSICLCPYFSISIHLSVCLSLFVYRHISCVIADLNVYLS